MKKSSIKKIVIITLTVVILLVIVVLLRSQPQQAPVPAFKFLSGRMLIAREEKNKSGINETLFVYSFEADFNNIVAVANSELSALGYINSIHNANLPSIKYYLHGKKPIELSSVYIIKNHIINAQYERHSRDGWVTVEIEQTKQKNRLIIIFKNFLSKFREPAE
jgi:hypothetical protein